MSTWVPASAGELLHGTPIAGSVEQVEAISSFLRDVSLDAWSFQLSIQQTQQQLRAVTADAITRLDAKLSDALTPGTAALMNSSDSAKRAIDGYASEVDRIHREARGLRNAVDDHLASIRSQSETIQTIARSIRVKVWYAWSSGAPGQMPEPQLGSNAEDLSEAQRAAAVQNLRALYENQWLYAATIWHADIEGIETAKTKWATLIEERKRAEGQLILALDATEIGQLITLAGGSGRSRKSTIALAIAGELWGSTAGALQMSTSHPLLKKLLGTESGGHIWNSPPDPTQVAAAWDKLTDSEREQLILAVPWVIGNLPGLPFSVRDAANRRALEYYAVHRDLLGTDSRTAVDELLKIIVAAGGTPPPVQVVALDLSREVPMVAVGYGNLDTADNLTWEVPGMESDAHNALAVWDRASRNLYTEQSKLATLNGTGSVGVISFLSYDTPNLGDSLGANGVLSPDLARAGAERLAAELDGTWATRNHGLGVTAGYIAPESPRISVIAHSYGTTTAANALTLTAHAVDSFSMAGSAGLDPGTVSSLDALHVKDSAPGQKAIFASHAAADKLAPIGLVLGGRANPNIALEYAHAQNLEGGYYYYSDGVTTADGQYFAPTNGHSVIGEEAPGFWDFGAKLKQEAGFEAGDGQGYWDRGTQSLRNLAASSLGLKEEIVGGVYVEAK